jgi:hypothetical protein
LQRHRTIIKGISAFYLHWERCSIQGQQIFPFSHWQIVNCFCSSLFCFYHSGRASGFRVLVSSSTPGNISNGRFTHTASSVSCYSLSFYHHHIMAGPGAGIWIQLQLAGIRYRRLVFSIVLRSFLPVFKDKRNTQQCTSLGRDRDRTNPYLDSRFLDLFSSLSFSLHGIERLTRKIPNTQKGPMDPPTPSLRFLFLRFAPVLRMIIMTTFMNR